MVTAMYLQAVRYRPLLEDTTVEFFPFEIPIRPSKN
jgi:hypothetical protein